MLLVLEKLGSFWVLTCELHSTYLTERLQRNKNAAMFFKILLLLLVTEFLLENEKSEAECMTKLLS